MVDWRKEIKLSDLVGRKRKDETPEEPEAAVPSAPAEETVELPPSHEGTPPAPVVEVSTTLPPEPAPAQPEPPPILAAPQPEPPPLPPIQQPTWPPAAGPEPAVPVLPPFPETEPAASPDPLGVAPVSSDPPEAMPPGGPAVSTPPPLLTGPARPVPPPLPGIHPPVPASELELPVPEPPKPEKTSFLKREVSFGRKSNESKAQPDGAESPEPKRKASLLKKEISFGRKPKADKQPAEAGPAQEQKAQKTSPLKREISFSFRRKPKDGPAAPKAGAEAPRLRSKPALRRRGDSAARRRQKRLVGLKVGASQLAAARIVNNGGPELVQVAREELAHGLVVGGELREPEALAEALKDFFRRHKLPRQGVRLGIANNRIGVRIFDIEGIDEPRKLENAIRFRAQEALPIPIEEAVLDYQVLSETVDDEGRLSRKILLVVAYRELIDRYVAACKKAGIRLAGIDLEAFALLRALADPKPAAVGTPEAALVVVAIGHDRSTFAVSDHQVCEFTRVLDWGGSTLNVAIARALDIAPSEAEPIKRALSLSHEGAVEGLGEQAAAAARDAVRRQLQSFARELVSSLQFYQNQPDSLGIGEIVLTGGTAHLEGLAEELQRLIGVHVRIGDPLARVRVGKRVRDREQLGSLAVAIGLGIED